MLFKGSPPHARSFEPIDHRQGQNPSGTASSVLLIVCVRESGSCFNKTVEKTFHHRLLHCTLDLTKLSPSIIR